MEFFQYKWTNEEMDIHLSTLQNLWKDLNTKLLSAGQRELPDLLLSCKILETLPSEYKAFKSSWRLTKANEKTLEASY